MSNWHMHAPGKAYSHTIILIKSPLGSSKMFDKIIQSIKDEYDYLILDLMDYIKKASLLSIDDIATRVCDELDNQNIGPSIFLAYGFGSLITFKISLERKDLMVGQILVSIKNGNNNSHIYRTQKEILKYLKKDEENRKIISLLISTIFGNGFLNNPIKEEVLLQYRKLGIEKIEHLIKIWNTENFCPDKISSNNVPTYLISAEMGTLVSSKDIFKFADSLGGKKDIIKIENVCNSLEILQSNQFLYSVGCIFKSFFLQKESL